MESKAVFYHYGFNLRPTNSIAIENWEWRVLGVGHPIKP